MGPFGLEIANKKGQAQRLSGGGCDGVGRQWMVVAATTSIKRKR